MNNTETNEPHQLQAFEPVSVKVVDIAPQGFLCQSNNKVTVDGLQVYTNTGTF